MARRGNLVYDNTRKQPDKPWECGFQDLSTSGEEEINYS